MDSSAGTRPLERYLPIVGWLRLYERGWLTKDTVAALSVWALLIPQSLAYASLAGVPVEYGLSSSFVALIAYAIFGTSRQLVQGPSAAVCAVSAASITPIIGAKALGSDQAVTVTAALALTTGVVYLLLGVFRMGWVSTFLSKAVMAGFVLGFALGIIFDQTHKLLGVPAPAGSYAAELWGTLQEIPDTSGTTLAVGAGSLAILILMRHFLPRWPRMLIVVALAIVVSSAFDLATHGVKVTGHVPTGPPSVSMPEVSWDHIGALLRGALAIVFVGYSESLASARAMARKHHYEIDTDQELIAQGMASGAAGFVWGFATDGSLSKTSVADAAGQRTQMASVINAVLVLLTMLLLAGLFETLPAATLGAVVIDAMLGLITFADLRRYYRVNRPDFVFSAGAGLGILFLGITQGILIGVVLSLLLLIARSSKTSIREVNRSRETGQFLDVSRHEGLESTPGVAILRVDGPLFFADADHFRTRLRELVEGGTACVVVDAEAVHLTDTDGADILIQVAHELQRQSTRLHLARVHPPVLALWLRAGVLDVVGHDAVFPTVHQAVDALAATPARVSDDGASAIRTPGQDQAESGA